MSNYELQQSDIDFLNSVAEEFGATVEIREDANAPVSAYYLKGQIVIYLDSAVLKSKSHLYSTFFHELQHHINCIQFFNVSESHYLESRQSNTLADEIYTDTLASLLMNEYCPHLTYIMAYSPELVLKLRNKDRNQLLKKHFNVDSPSVSSSEYVGYIRQLKSIDPRTI